MNGIQSLAVLATVLCATGCMQNGRRGGSAPPPASPPPESPSPAPAAPDAKRLSGNVDVRPFVAHVAYALRRGDGDIDIKVFDRPVGPEIGCLSGEQGLVDTQRTVWIQMEWPVQVGSVWTSSISSTNQNKAGVFFMVRRGLGGSGQRAAGDVRVIESSSTGGVLHVNAATPNEVGGVHGSVQGELPFSICG